MMDWKSFLVEHSDKLAVLQDARRDLVDAVRVVAKDVVMCNVADLHGNPRVFARLQTTRAREVSKVAASGMMRRGSDHPVSCARGNPRSVAQLVRDVCHRKRRGQRSAASVFAC